MMGKRSYESMSASEERPSVEPSSRSVNLDHHRAHISKSMVIEELSPTMMQCSLPPHPTSVEFQSLEAFEAHYTKEHTNRCTSCGKNFPTDHFLALHLDEAHNPVREVLASKGEKTYSCFVDGCDRKCSNPAKRRLHLIDKHGYPKIYNFAIVQTGIDKTTSLLREGQKRRVSTTKDSPMRHHRRISAVHTAEPEHHSLYNLDGPGGKAERASHELVTDSQELTQLTQGSVKISGPDDHMEELETSFSALTFVPRSVRSRKAHKTSSQP